MTKPLVINDNPPVNSVVLCPKIPAGGYADFGQTLLKLETVIGMYTDCRLRHEALVEYENKKVK